MQQNAVSYKHSRNNPPGGDHNAGADTDTAAGLLTRLPKPPIQTAPAAAICRTAPGEHHVASANTFAQLLAHASHPCPCHLNPQTQLQAAPCGHHVADAEPLVAAPEVAGLDVTLEAALEGNVQEALLARELVLLSVLQAPAEQGKRQPAALQDQLLSLRGELASGSASCLDNSYVLWTAQAPAGHAPATTTLPKPAACAGHGLS